MSTESVTASALRTLEEYQSSTSKTKSSGSDIDVDDFLKLFVAQLSSQDPLSGSSGSGSSGTDYISQLAQLTMLKQMSALNESFSTNQAYSMIGKYVYIGDGTSSDLTIGKVDGVINDGGVSKLMVGGETYDLSEIYAVVDGSSAATDDEVLKSAELIGKTVTATVKDTAGVESTVTGKVDKVQIKSGVIYLVIGDKNVALSNITEIAETAAASTTTA